MLDECICETDQPLLLWLHCSHIWTWNIRCRPEGTEEDSLWFNPEKPSATAIKRLPNNHHLGLPEEGAVASLTALCKTVFQTAEPHSIAGLSEQWRSESCNPLSFSYQTPHQTFIWCGGWVIGMMGRESGYVGRGLLLLINFPMLCWHSECQMGTERTHARQPGGEKDRWVCMMGERECLHSHCRPLLVLIVSEDDVKMKWSQGDSVTERRRLKHANLFLD